MPTPPPNIRAAISRRSWWVAAVIFMAGVAIVTKIIILQNFTVHKNRPLKALLNRTMHLDTIEAMRGNVYSSDGSLLATSLPYYIMSLDPMVASSDYFNEKLDTLATNVAWLFKKKTFEECRKSILTARKDKDRDIRLVSRALTLREYEIVRTWPFFRKLQSGRTRGGKLAIFYQRYKPFGGLAARTIGDIDPETNVGTMGIEASFQKELRGKQGVGLMAILDDGTRMSLDNDQEIQPESGADVHTTIDVNFQDIAENALEKVLRKYRAEYGTAIVMKVQTGEIKAMVNLRKHKDSIFVDDLNYAVTGLAHPGSTFKLATMLAVMEEGKVNPKTLIETGQGYASYNGVNVRDTHGNGTLSTADVLVKSSNVGIHLLMKKSGFYQNQQKYIDYLDKFGLMGKTGFDMKGELLPTVRRPGEPKWNKPTSPTFISYGYEFEYTPLQMLTFYNAIANDGFWVKPMIVRQIKNGEKIDQDILPIQKPNRIASQKSIAEVQQMLENVVIRGTATNISGTKYGIAGKTGTAQLPTRSGYKEGIYNVSFAGYFPTKDPQYSCIVLVNYPKANTIEERFAAGVTAPVFREIADRIIGYDITMHPPLPQRKNEQKIVASHLKTGHADDLRSIAQDINIDSMPDLSGWVEAKSSKKGIKWNHRDTEITNLTGMTLRDAVYLLENKGYKVSFSGHGKVVSYQHTGNKYQLVLR